MGKQSVRHLLQNMDFRMKLFEKNLLYRRFVYNVSNRTQSQLSKAEKDESNVSKEAKDRLQVPVMPKVEKNVKCDSQISKYRSSDDDLSDNNQKLELAWLTKALEPALQLCRRALPTGNGFVIKSPVSSRSLMETVANIQWNKLGFQDWNLSDLTIGLYLIYLQQASKMPFEDVKGVQISSDAVVQDLIYHIELAKGAYRDNAAGLARNSMLRESNVVKFVKSSSVMRPGYYIGIDVRKKHVILGIRGTFTVQDLITNIVSSSKEEVTFEGYSTHFGTAEAARWFINHEIGTIKKCLEKHKVAKIDLTVPISGCPIFCLSLQASLTALLPFYLFIYYFFYVAVMRLIHLQGFRLRLVGHSLGGATASLIAIMLRKKSTMELGFSPDIVTAVGYATPPCVSRELAECCSDYVTTVVMQDDIIPRLSVASLTRLRNEILQTDWMTVLEKEDWKSVIGLVTNAKHVVSSVQDVARKLADYAKFRDQAKVSDLRIRKEPLAVPGVLLTSKANQEAEAANAAPELFVPGSVYYLKRNGDNQKSNSSNKATEFFTLWKRHPGEHFRRILLSGNLISDHKCDSHYYALRDVLKGLPGPIEETIFK